MGEVVHLRGGNLIKRLELLLDEAKAGKLEALAYAAIDGSRYCATGWAGQDYSISALGGAILMLQSRYGRDMMALATDEPT